jgi:cell shape-determining protein MreD
MTARSPAFWVFIGVLVLLHLVLRLALNLTFVPDLLVVALLLGSRRLSGGGAAPLRLFLCILADSLTLLAFGATAVAFVVVGFIGARSRNLFEGDSYLFVAFYAFIGAWLIEAVRFLVGRMIGQPLEPFALVSEAAISALFTAIAAVVAMAAYRFFTGNR